MSLRKLAIGLLTGTAAVALAVPAGSALTIAAGGGARVAERAAATEASAAQLLDPAYLARGMCGTHGKNRGGFFKPRVLLAAATGGAQEMTREAQTDVPLWNFLGDLTYPITTKDEMAQR